MQKTHFTKFFFLSLGAFIISIFIIVYIVKTNTKDIQETAPKGGTAVNTQQVKITEETSTNAEPFGNVEIVSPTKDSQVSSIMPIFAEISRTIEISKVEFYVDKKLLTADTKQPYNGIWDTTKESNGVHIINVKSYDKKDSVISSKSIFVTVFNNKEAVTTKKGLPVGPQFVN